MDSATYRHIMGQLKKSCQIPHYNFPCHNLVSIDTLAQLSKDDNDLDSEFLSTFPCFQPFPYEVDKTTLLLCGSGTWDDPVLLVNRKRNWETKCDELNLADIEKARKMFRGVKNGDVIKVNKSLQKCLDLYQSDPEPSFSGNYNWLYTGGCLSYDKSYDEVLLVSSTTSSGRPTLNILQLNQTLDQVDFKIFAHIKFFTPILQTTCQSLQGHTFICVRQKNHLSLLKLDRTNTLNNPQKVWRKKVVGSKLLTCTDFKSDCEEILLTDSNFDVNIFSAEKKVKIYASSAANLKINVKDVKDRWNQIVFGEKGIYWAFRNSLYVLDSRDFSSGAKVHYEPSAVVDSCESICSMLESSDSNYVYLATNHNILQVDLRNNETVQRWTHMMKTCPQFLSAANSFSENREILLLQSYDVDEILGISNDFAYNGFLSKSLPCSLKNIKASLKLSHYHGVCLNPSISQRLDFSVTGMSCTKNINDEIVIFIQNSAGDIFRSRLKNKNSGLDLNEEDEKEIVDSMKVMENKSYALKQKPVKTKLKYLDMSEALEEFKKPVENKKKARMSNGEKFYWRYHEKYSPESLIYFKDVLAEKILKVWSRSFHYPDLEPMSVDDKVQQWINQLS